MGVRREAALVATVARTETVRSARAVLSDRRQLAAFGIAALGLLPAASLVFPGMYATGRAVSSGQLSLPVAAARGQFVLTYGGLVALGAVRALERSTSVDHAGFLLTTVPARVVAVGLFFAEYARTLAVLAPLFGLFFGAFLLGAGTPGALLVVLPVGAVALCSALAAGHLLGLVVRNLSRALRIPRRAAKAVGVLIAIVASLAAVLAAPTLVRAVTAPPEALAGVPIASYADLLFLGTPAEVGVGTGVDVLVAVGGVLLVIAVSLSAAGPLSARLWLRDAPARGSTDRTVSVPASLGGTRLGRSVFWLWLRGIRAPSRFVHLLYVFFFGFGIVGSVLGTERPLLWTPPVVVLFGALLAGGAFGLNPLGDEGDALPVVVLSPLPAATLVRARMLAGTLPVAPVAVLAAVGAGLAGPMPPLTTALVAGFGVSLSGYSAAVAVGFGALIPRFDAERVFGVETVSPTAWALFGYLSTVGLAGAVGFAAVFLPPAVLGVSAPAARVGLLGGVCLVLALPAVAGYLYAVERLASFTYE